MFDIHVSYTSRLIVNYCHFNALNTFVKYITAKKRVNLTLIRYIGGNVSNILRKGIKTGLDNRIQAFN